MKRIQLKYSLLNILLMAISCGLYGYATIILENRGLSNTQIGIVKGGGCILLVLFSSQITGLVQKIKGFSSRKLCLSVYIVVAVLTALVFIKSMPVYLLMVVYTIDILAQLTAVPITVNMGMEYLQKGAKLNFGFAKGMGSLSYAIGAVILGQIIEIFSPEAIIKFSMTGTILMIILLLTMPDVYILKGEEIKHTSFLEFFKKYKLFLLILTGFGFCYAATTAMETYLNNIVGNLGGGAMFFGIGIFCSAASELPAMSVSWKMKQKFGSHKLLMFAAIVYVIRSFTISFAPNLVVLMIGELLQGPGYGLFMAVIAYYVAEHLEMQDQMQGQTCVSIFMGGAGATLGNVCGGALQDLWGLNVMLGFACVVTALGCCIVLSQVKKA